MENLPRDVLFSIALTMDFPEVLSLCKTNSRINNVLCRNENFWLYKLKNNYNVNKSDMPVGISPKDYYEEIYRWLKDYPNINHAYDIGIMTDRLDMVKIALDRGADINHNKAVLMTVIYRHDKLREYLLSRGIISSEEDMVTVIYPFLNEINRAPPAEKIRILRVLYDEIIPIIYNYTSNKDLYRVLANKLEEVYRRYPGMSDVYERHIEELRSRA